LKTPGESDGCTEILPDGSACPRFDSDCGSDDSLGSKGDEPRAPEAGQWFDFEIKQLASNAKFQRRLGEGVRAFSTASNPFEGKEYYVNPSYAESLGNSIITADGDVKVTLEAMVNVASAYWLDTKDKIRGSGTKTMEGILADAAAQSPPRLVTFIVYDLPNRDCHAKASNGEICCKYISDTDRRCDYTFSGDCTAGMDEYKTLYINEIADVLAEWSHLVPIVLVIEPDSLPNLSTNQADPRCGNDATQAAYKEGIAYAVGRFAEKVPQAAVYLDAGHGGWLGWKDNMNDFVATIKDLGVADHLRGFATNVAGYQGLGIKCPTYDYCLNNAHPSDPCCEDPCGLLSQWDPSQNEHNYAMHLRKAMSEGIPGFIPHMIIDTGRNGVADARNDCKNWCNVRGAGVGVLPTTMTADPELIDAYFWLKTPGESDGCTEILPDGSACPRFDSDCGSDDSLGSVGDEPRAPEAGQWFDFEIKQLAQNAQWK